MCDETAETEEDYWSDADENALAEMNLDFTNSSIGVRGSACKSIEMDRSSMVSNKFTLECDKMLENLGAPLERYRPRYLTVSDLASQHWCEQKLLYNFSPEVYVSRAEPGVEVKVQEDVDAKVAKGKGSDIHLSRELEIQVPVEIPVVTKEDKWAVRFHNLQMAILSFLCGSKIAREIPVFGCPFESDIFIFGIVDEITFDPSSHRLEISELKTRRSLHLPKKSHQEKDKFQLGIYRQLFDELVLGKVTKDSVERHLCVDLNTPLSEEVVKHLRPSDAHGDLFNLSTVLDTLLNQVQSMTCIESGRVEYVHQDTVSHIAFVSLDKDAQEVRHDFEHFTLWWRGDRGTHGVDIEDCWKCDFCEFSSLCEWRDFMAQKTSKRAAIREKT